MKFRPCIDIHNGKVKQIVGGSLLDKGDYAKDNFVSEKDGETIGKETKQNGSESNASCGGVTTVQGGSAGLFPHPGTPV